MKIIMEFHWMVSKVLLFAIVFSISSSSQSMDPLQAPFGKLPPSRAGLFQLSENQINIPKRSPPVINKRRPEDEDDRQLVTIDLSALRPSLPGLVLYKYGDHAPKLVQVDLATLNPLMQPHVIWPQYHQQINNHGESHFDVIDDLGLDANIPFLDDNTLVNKNQKMARMTSGTSSSEWPDFNDLGDEDVYDFLSDSSRNEELMALHDNLPLADEVIVPLDWEEGTTYHFHDKRNVFLSQGWKPGGYSANRATPSQSEKPKSSGSTMGDTLYSTPFGSYGWRPGRKKNSTPKAYEIKSRHSRVESEEIENPEGKGDSKKNIYFSNVWGRRERSSTELNGDRLTSPNQPETEHGQEDSNSENALVRISSQQWTIPKQRWKVPQLFRSQW